MEDFYKQLDQEARTPLQSRVIGDTAYPVASPKELAIAKTVTATIEKDKLDKYKQLDVEAKGKSGSYLTQLYGASMEGWMQLGQGVVSLPAHTVRQIKPLALSGLADAALKEKDPKKQKWYVEQMNKREIFLDKFAAKLSKPGESHKRGMETILRNHPEWESEPPESFVDLLSSPDKLSLALAQSTPILLSAGIMTAAGAPQLGVALMYASEGQQAYDLAIQDGASETDAETAYVIYGSVSAALENMQLQGIMKIGKGMFNQLVNRTAQKVARKGMGSLTMDVIKMAAKEGLEEISQGTWGEITAKIVYDKSVPGGVAGFIDRRAQEGYIGFMMGIIPGAAGGITGKAIGGVQAKAKTIERFTSKESPLKTEQYAILTAENPGNQALNPGENAERNELLLADIKEMGLTPVPVKGKYGGPIENSFIVFGMTDEQALELGKKYGQKSVLTPKGLIYQDGSINKIDLENINFDVKQEDFYSEIDIAGKEIKFGIPLTGTKIEARPISSVEQKPGETFKGPAYRVETGLGSSADETAADVIRFEQEELGNDLGVSKEKLAELEKRPAKDIIWVGKLKEDVARYGVEAGKEETITPEQVESLVDEVTGTVEGGEIIATDDEGGYLILKSGAKKTARKKALKIGHDVPKKLGWSEKKRRAFQKEITGKESMKPMTPAELEKLTAALKEKAKEAGIEYEELDETVNELVETLEKKKPTEIGTEAQRISKTAMWKLRHTFKSTAHTIYEQLTRIERFLEALDGYEEGAHYKHIWLPMKKAAETSNMRINQEVAGTFSQLENKNIDTTLWMGKQEAIPGTDLKITASQRIGIYWHSQNRHGRRYLNSLGYSDKTIDTVKKIMGSEEVAFAEWLMEQKEARWPIILKAAEQAGIDPATLKKEFGYAPIIRTDAGLEMQDDFLNELAESFQQKSFKPEAGMLEARKGKTTANIEIDGLIMHLQDIARVERFIAMAPVANKTGKILNNRTFKEALNKRTYKQGSKLLNTWMADVIRGSSKEIHTYTSRLAAIMRHNGIVYALGYNLPSAMRQTLSGATAIAIDPLMMKNVPLNIAKASTPKSYQAMEEFVYSRSPEMANRSLDRDIRHRWNRVAMKKGLTYKAFGERIKAIFGAAKAKDVKMLWAYYKSGHPLSKRALAWIRFMDKHTCTVVWKSIYDIAGEMKTAKQFERLGVSKAEAQKFIKEGCPENRRIELADKWTGRTQPMANVEWLPQFFRGGTLEKLLSTFQNFINNYGNFYAHDIIGARRAGKIGNTIVAYRVMWSWIIPAMLFGMIGRGRHPRDWKEIGIDLGTYPVAPLIIIGRLIDRMIRGWGNSGNIAEMGLESAVKTGRAIGRGDVPKIIKGAIQTYGALTGHIPAQLIRTTEGAIDMAAGTTDDPRRLIYSKWALEQGKTKKKGKALKY